VLLSWHWCASSMNQFASFLAEDGGQVYAWSKEITFNQRVTLRKIIFTVIMPILNVFCFVLWALNACPTFFFSAKTLISTTQYCWLATGNKITNYSKRDKTYRSSARQFTEPIPQLLDVLSFAHSPAPLLLGLPLTKIDKPGKVTLCLDNMSFEKYIICLYSCPTNTNFTKF
jgi:hypothetical protein